MEMRKYEKSMISLEYAKDKKWKGRIDAKN
jgi:hypothetical protein